MEVKRIVGWKNFLSIEVRGESILKICLISNVISPSLDRMLFLTNPSNLTSLLKQVRTVVVVMLLLLPSSHVRTELLGAYS